MLVPNMMTICNATLSGMSVASVAANKEERITSVCLSNATLNTGGFLG